MVNAYPFIIYEEMKKFIEEMKVKPNIKSNIEWLI